MGIGRIRRGIGEGDALSGDERQKVIDQMARYTGLSKQSLMRRICVSMCPSSLITFYSIRNCG